jgi:hypothetical protein
MSNHAKIGSLSARIGEVSRAIEKLQSELTDLGHQLQRAIVDEKSPERPSLSGPGGSQPLVRRAGVIVSPASPGNPASASPHSAPRRLVRGRAGTIPAQVARLLAESPDRQYKPRELAERLNLSGTQARSLGITLLRLRKEGRVGFNPETKTYHRPQA